MVMEPNGDMMGKLWDQSCTCDCNSCNCLVTWHEKNQQHTVSGLGDTTVGKIIVNQSEEWCNYHLFGCSNVPNFSPGWMIPQTLAKNEEIIGSSPRIRGIKWGYMGIAISPF